MIEKVAVADVRVLITVSNGSRKELVLHWLHEKLVIAKSPMIEVNCGAILSKLIESELFGHVTRSFTAANKDSTGYLSGQGVIIFLDEIRGMSLSA